MSDKKEELMTGYLYKHFISPEIKESFSGNAGVILFPALSCVRLFDASMISKLANVYAPELFEHWKIEDYGDLLREYIKSQMLVWKKGYSIEPSMRVMTEAYLKNHDEKRWRAVNERALGIYREWLERPVDQRGLFVVEESYHMAKLGSYPKDILKVFRRRLGDYRVRYYDRAERGKQLQYVTDLLSMDTEIEATHPEVHKLLLKEVEKAEWLS